MSVKKNTKKLSSIIAGTCLVSVISGCSYFSGKDVPFLNARVDNGVVILGSDPGIDSVNKTQSEVEIVTSDNYIKPSKSQSAKASKQVANRDEIVQKTEALNKYLLAELDFSSGDAKKAKLSKSKITDLMNLYNLGLERYANKNQLAYLSKYVEKALDGSLLHQENLADFYLDGLNGESYEQLAISWYLIAAKGGSAYSKYMMSILYQLGLGLPQDLSESVVWYKKASESNGSAEAKIKVAKRYLNPNSLIQDQKQAFVWMQSAADQSDYEAQYLLADMYLQGKGVEKSPMDAINWYGKAAEQNSAYAQYSLGVMFYNGQGTEQNLLEAKKWLEYAAWQGHGEAQYLLSRMYQQGFGVEKSLPKAYAWYSLVQRDGVVMDNFDKRANELISAMTPEEKIEADKIATEYKSKVVLG